MKPEEKDIIKSEIELMFGRRIVSSRDCIQLSEEIFRITKATLNVNTIRRFFGLVKTAYSPSHATIQILCSYCGFLSIEEVENFNLKKNSFADAPAQKSLLNYLVNLFNETPVDIEKNDTFKSVVKQTILFLYQHPGLVEKFQCLVAKTKKGQDYYFEDFIYIDQLNSYYGNGLRYYLSEKDEPEAQVFGNSLLVFRYWLTEDEPNLERHFQQVNNFGPFLAQGNGAPGRYFACLLYYCHAKDISAADITMSIHKYYSVIQDHDTRFQIVFEITVAEALILTGSYKEGLFYTRKALKKTQNFQEMEQSVVQHLYLLQAFALNKTGDKENARGLYAQIRPSSFSFLNKKMQTILYNSLSGALKINSNEPYDQAHRLILETGFSRLRKLIS